MTDSPNTALQVALLQDDEDGIYKQAWVDLEKEKQKLEVRVKQLQNSNCHELEKFEVKRSLGLCTFGEVRDHKKKYLISTSFYHFLNFRCFWYAKKALPSYLP